MRMSKERFVPKLRFYGFADQKWRKISFIDVSDRKVKWSFTGGPFGSSLQSSDYTEKGVRIIQLQNIGDGEFHNDYQLFTSEEKADELLSCNIYPGDIIMSKMGDPVGRATLIPNYHQRYVMCSDGIRVVVDQSKFSKYFIYTLINSDHFRLLVEKTATGSTRKRIGLDDLKNLPIMVPVDLEEQQKLADCLSSLDELITAENQKLKALQQHKKGLMQQLFPAGGEKVPKLRFKEFKDSGEWEEKPLGDIGEFTGGGTPSKEVDSFWRGNIPWISSSDISEESIHQIKITRFITEEALINSATKKIPRGSILLVSRVGVGKLAISNESVCTSQDFTNFTPKNDCLVFLAYYLKFYSGKLLELSQGMAIKGFTKDDISKLKLFLPSRKSEQQKIADCLSSLDALLTDQNRKVENLKIHKKGLVQQLFPKAAEIEA